MKPLGHVLLWIGFIGAAFVSLSRLEQSAAKWSTIPWSWYILAASVGFAGVIILRLANRKDGADESKTESQFSVVTQSLDRVSTVVTRLCGQSTLIPSEVLRCIDQECAEPLAEFADSREALIKRFGLDTYASVMTEFASAERYLNRSWSAAADGYVDEVAASLSRANVHLGKAKAIIASVE